LSQPKPSALPTTFYRRRVKNEQLSKIEGRDVFEDHAWVRVRNGVDLLDHPVTQKDIDAAPAEHAAFLEGREPPGTPLSVLIAEAPDMMTQELADQLKSARGITTLEQVVAVADGNFIFGAGRALQRKAKETLSEYPPGGAPKQDVAAQGPGFQPVRKSVAPTDPTAKAFADLQNHLAKRRMSRARRLAR